MSAGHWRELTVAVWGALAVSIVAMLALARAGLAGLQWPAHFLVPALRNRAIRVVVLLGWAWLGWHLFAR